MARVVLEGLRKVYDNGQVAVADASFEVADGELLVLVGPSGCGKSTLLRMIAGLESISAGTLSIDGRVVNEMPPGDRDIAMVFQNYALYPHMSVAENLGFGLKLRGLAKPEVARRVAEAAALLGLVTLLERRPAQLSGGQRQRVALGRALVRNPKVFLLDEPLSNLDAKLRYAMRVEIARLHRRLGATMLYVTHDQIEAMTLGQRIVVLNDGEIQQIDTPGKLYAEPANLFVAAFLGAPEMNLFRGRLRAHGGVRLDLGAVTLPLPGLDLARSRLAAWIDREVVVGIRPEHLHWPAAEDEAALGGRVELVESVGSEQFVHLASEGVRALARIVPGPLPDGYVELGFRPADVHFFAPDSGRRIG